MYIDSKNGVALTHCITGATWWWTREVTSSMLWKVVAVVALAVLAHQAIQVM